MLFKIWVTAVFWVHFSAMNIFFLVFSLVCKILLPFAHELSLWSCPGTQLKVGRESSGLHMGNLLYNFARTPSIWYLIGLQKWFKLLSFSCQVSWGYNGIIFLMGFLFCSYEKEFSTDVKNIWENIRCTRGGKRMAKILSFLHPF